MTDRDEFYNKAKQQGYRARSAFKLQQIDEAEDVFGYGDRVVDLGARPGGWTQVAAEAVGSHGRVVAVDRASMEPFDADCVSRVRGDVTEERTRDRIRTVLRGESADDPAPHQRATLGASDAISTGDASGEGNAGAEGDTGDTPTSDDERATTGGRAATDERDAGDTRADDETDRLADAVVSDMAPNMSGEYELDHARSIGLAESALEAALAVLAPGGDFVVKVFDGRDLDAFREEMAESFEYVRSIVPEASRDSSSERYLVGKGRLDAPVAVGDQRTVEVTHTGSEGDGVAQVDGYTLFVPDAEPGETVAVRVTDVRARFGFAERR